MDHERRWKWDAALGRGLPGHLAGRERFRQALQGDRTAGAESEATSRAYERSQELGGKNLSTVGPVAEPLGDHHGRAEIVVLVTDRFPDVQADADPEPLIALA